MIDGFNNVEYEERLRRLKLPTLVYRRARWDMIEVWKHFQSLIPNTFRRQLYETEKTLPTCLAET